MVVFTNVGIMYQPCKYDLHKLMKYVNDDVNVLERCTPQLMLSLINIAMHAKHTLCTTSKPYYAKC